MSDLLEISKKIVDDAFPKYKNDVGKVVVRSLFQILYGYYHLIKHVAYAGEKEWRMIQVMPRMDHIQYDLKSGDTIKRYIEGPPLEKLLITNSSITVGPTVPSPDAARGYLEHLVRKVHKITSVDVRRSDKTYRRTSPPTQG